ncbi:MAG: hypothetical protein FWH18_02265 [Marinilabiliaceae bacterium]|nr:hypothetical protein [Marinilabiliaceae bacterium]
MLSFIKNLFKKEEEKDWLEPLFDHIEIVKKKNLEVPFRIFEIKKSGFLIKVEGLFAFVPFSLMPWKYQNYDQWNAVLPSLKKRVFHGTIAKVTRKEGETGVNRVFVDASKVNFDKPELSDSETYKGIIFQKTDFGIFVDIGHHFAWQYGSIRGLIHRTNFPSSEFIHNYHIGKIVEVKMIERSQKGLLLKFAGNNYNLETYVGKIVQTKVIKVNKKPLSFLVEDQYHAQMPMKNIYGENIYLIKNLMKYFTNDEIIECEVINYNTLNGYLSLKFLPKNNTGYDWNSQEIQDYIGKTVQAYVYRSVYYGATLMVDNKYRAMVTNDIPTRKRILNQMKDGTTIECVVLSANTECGIFIVDANALKPKVKQKLKYKLKKRLNAETFEENAVENIEENVVENIETNED